MLRSAGVLPLRESHRSHFHYINGSAPNTPTGTIVLINGGGGQMTLTDNNDATASDYATAGYAVVPTAWATDWENADDGLGMNAPRLHLAFSMQPVGPLPSLTS